MAGKWISSGLLVDIWTSFTPTPMQVLIAGLATDGLTAKLDRLWVFAQASEALALVDIIAGATATNVNSMTFTTNVGYTGDGASNYIDCNWNPNSLGGNWLQDSACLFGWNNLSGAVGALAGGGFYGPSFNTAAYIRLNAAGVYIFGLNSVANFGTGAASAGDPGLYALNRTISTTVTLDLNGSQVDTSSLTSVEVFNNTIKADLIDGAAFGNCQVCCIGGGGGLTSTDRTNLYNRLRTYMTAVGVP